MKKSFGLLVCVLLFALPGFAQEKHPSGGGHIPAHGPAPVKSSHPVPEHRTFNDKAGASQRSARALEWKMDRARYGTR